MTELLKVPKLQIFIDTPRLDNFCIHIGSMVYDVVDLLVLKFLD